MNNTMKTQNSDNLIERIKTARNKANDEARAYRNYKPNRYNYWWAMAMSATYDDVVYMFECGTEHEISGMLTTAIAESKRACDGETTEIILAVANGRRDALATVTDWMNTKESNR